MINTPEEIAALFPQEVPAGACPNDDADYFCTREDGHEPPHIAHDTDGREVARW